MMHGAVNHIKNSIHSHNANELIKRTRIYGITTDSLAKHYRRLLGAPVLSYTLTVYLVCANGTHKLPLGSERCGGNERGVDARLHRDVDESVRSDGRPAGRRDAPRPLVLALTFAPRSDAAHFGTALTGFSEIFFSLLLRGRGLSALALNTVPPTPTHRNTLQAEEGEGGRSRGFGTHKSAQITSSSIYGI